MALHYLSPFRSTWHYVRPTEDLNELPPDPRRLYIESLHEFYTYYTGLKPIQECDDITARFFKLEDTNFTIPAWRPQAMPIVA